MSPATAGAVTVKVKLAVPPAATGPGTLHVSSAPAALGSPPQMLPVAAVATTPAGSWSWTTTVAPVAAPPVLETVSV